MSTIAVDSIEPKTSGGAVLFPNRPAFKCRGYGGMLASQVVNGVTVHSNSSIIFNWNVVDINRDNAFNNTTGRYNSHFLKLQARESEYDRLSALLLECNFYEIILSLW